MGSRDYRHRETKKQKKDLKNLPKIDITTTPQPVDVIRKKKKKREEEEEV